MRENKGTASGRGAARQLGRALLTAGLLGLASLAQALPVAVHYRTPWLVKVGPLDNAAKKNAFLV